MHVAPFARFGPAVVRTVDGPDGSPLRVLEVGGAYQSATYLDERRYEPAFSYYRAFDLMFETGAPVRDVLMLGAGGCSWPKYLVTHRAGVRIDAIEADPAVARLARRWFFVEPLLRESAGAPRRLLAPGSSLSLVVDDGRRHLERCLANGRRYDAVANDAYVGAGLASSFATVEAGLLVKRVLRPGGCYLVNASSSAGGFDVTAVARLVDRLSRAFAHVHVVPCADAGFAAEDNYLVVATDASCRFDGEISFLTT